MITRTETHKALKNFTDYIVIESKKNLASVGTNASSSLSESIKDFVKVSENSIDVSVLMNNYGRFIDRGVTGKGDSDFKGKDKPIQKSLSGFRFGSGNYRGTGEAWKTRINSWMYSRGIAPRDFKTGRFIKRDTTNFLIRRSIFQHGIKPTKFMTTPFEVAFSTLPDEVVEAYGLDIVNFMNFTLKTREDANI